MKKIILCLLVIFLIGCEKKTEVKSYINEDLMVSINYPVTNIMVLDNAISSYVNQNYEKFKNIKQNKQEFNI